MTQWWGFFSVCFQKARGQCPSFGLVQIRGRDEWVLIVMQNAVCNAVLSAKEACRRTMRHAGGQCWPFGLGHLQEVLFDVAGIKSLGCGCKSDGAGF
jgi:hypothetical protein